MKILIIEDDAAVAQVLADSVTLAGHEAIVASNGEAGLAKLAESGADAVFLDVVMPGLDGIHVLRLIRAREPDLPVVIITGQASPENLKEARLLGVTDIVEKPTILVNLESALRDIAARRPQNPR